MKVFVKKKKPTKWRFKLFALCDSVNNYQVNFEFYTGQGPDASENRKTNDLVLRLMDPLLDLGYNLFIDNYYTSYALANSLLARQGHLVRTVNSNRKGFPDALNNILRFQRGERGDMRCVRDGLVTNVKWLDKRAVTLLSTMQVATDFIHIERKAKQDCQWVTKRIKAPPVLTDYNSFTSGIDAFDHLATTCKSLRRSRQLWKVLLCDLLETATINSYVIIKEYMVANPGSMTVAATSISSCSLKTWFDSLLAWILKKTHRWQMLDRNIVPPFWRIHLELQLAVLLFHPHSGTVELFRVLE